MRTTLEDLYYGNITPNEQQMTPDSELEKAVARVTKYENQLMEQLEEIDQETLTKLIRFCSSHVSSHSPSVILLCSVRSMPW